jgi:hypothetical protein
MRILLLAGFLGLSVQPSIAAHTETAIDPPGEMLEASHEIASDAPKKVYIESSRRSISPKEENCFYNDEHAHIHCYESDEYQNASAVRSSYRSPNRSSDRTVIYRTRDRDYAYRNTNGLAIGLAVGIPWLIHNSHHDRHYSRPHYGYRSHHNYEPDYGHRSHKRSYKRSHNRKH